MKFVKIPYHLGTGYRLINLDQINLIETNTKSRICTITFNNNEKIILVYDEALTLLEAVSSFNHAYKNWLALGLPEKLEEKDF